MENSDKLIQHLTEENRWLKERLDIALNAIAKLQEENQCLKDEIATLKGQKPRPKISPSALEGAKSKDKQNDKNKVSRGKHPRRKKTAHLEIHARNRIKPESIPVGAVFKGCQKFTVQDIIINENTADYIESLKPSHWLGGYLVSRVKDHSMTQTEWEAFLFEMNVRSTGDVKLATEAALFASLLANGIPKDLGVHGDDAGQFNVFVRSLCWIHEERHYRKLIPSDEATRQAIEQVRGEIWDLYKGLQEYQLAPSDNLKAKLNTAFDDLFQNKITTSPTLNNQLAKTYAKKVELLRVLERPETPLHNNGTETDAREMVVKRKISGGTRSEEGQKCRDTFISIKKTCVKLEICFLRFLEDRIGRLFEISRLAQLILERSAKQSRRPQTCP